MLNSSFYQEKLLQIDQYFQIVEDEQKILNVKIEIGPIELHELG